MEGPPDPGSDGPAVTIGNKEMSISEAADQTRRGANWFYWIAGLSLANSVANALNLGYAMILGLGITQIVDLTARMLIEEDESVRGVALVVSLVFSVSAALVFVFLGYHARKLRMWPYYLGIPLYLTDALIFLWIQDWLGLGFHVFVLVMLFAAASSTRKVIGAQARPSATEPLTPR